VNLNEPILDRMKLFLDYSVRKQEIITSNLANAETPGYRARQLRFEEMFQSAVDAAGPLRTTDSRHIRSGRPTLLRKPAAETTITDALGHDRNNVDLDQEITALAQNVLKFSVVSQMMQQKMRVIQMSLREGRN
jgi:flagellar basal-body rod protein FlgB